MTEREEQMAQREPYAVVIGGLNKDIGGKPHAPLIDGDSNPGKVTVSIGGVGHNIASNTALLGVKTVFLTALGNDEFTMTVTKACRRENIDISHAQMVSDRSSATYLFITDESGNMVEAVSDMDIFEHLTPDYLKQNLSVINGAKVVVLDTNIPEESIVWLSKNCRVPIFVDPVSTTKAKKLRRSLGCIHTLKPNKMEAEYLTGVSIVDNQSLEEAGKRLLQTGMKRVFISLSDEGVFCCDHSGCVKLPCIKSDLINTTGGGDAFMGGLVWAFLHGMNLSDSGKIGIGAAAIAVESAETVNFEQMKIENILKRVDIENNSK